MAAHPLSMLPRDARILLDANIFIYAFMRRSPQCIQLVERSRNGEVTALTTIEVVNEVCHRLMLLEALERGIINKISAPALRAKSAEVRNLTRYWALTQGIFNLNITVLPLDETRVRAAFRLRAAHGLLTNDSLIAAAAQEQSIDGLATSDRDFERIDWLTTYRPTDLGLH